MCNDKILVQRLIYCCLTFCDEYQHCIATKTCNLKKRNIYFVFHILWNDQNCDVSFAVECIFHTSTRSINPFPNDKCLTLPNIVCRRQF